MAEIVVKVPPKPQPLRPTQRPASAVQSPLVGKAGTQLAAMRPASASNLAGALMDATAGAGRVAAAAAGAGPGDAAAAGRPSGQFGPRRKFGSKAPPDRSVHPFKGGFFERLTPQEAADRLDGIAGTTLPGAAALQEHRERAYVQAELARAEREAASAQDIDRRRAELAEAQQTRVPASQQRFAWGSDRIASALLSKFDSFTARHEDHTRKLIWTFGTDPHFKEPGSRNAIRVTPNNLPKVADRFGIACTTDQAQEIFARHGLPSEGCSMQKLSSAFIDTKVDMANIVRDQARRMHGDAARPASVTRARSPKREHVPHKNAFLPSAAWQSHADGAPSGGPA